MRADGEKKRHVEVDSVYQTDQIVKKGDKADCFSEIATVSDPWDQLVVIVIDGIFLLSSLRASPTPPSPMR